MNRVKVLIAGIAGASLGTEILKSLTLAGNYDVYGCDISNLAYGLYEPGFVKTFLIDRTNYVQQILDVCVNNDIALIIPGGDQPAILLTSAKEKFENKGIILLSNSTEVTETCGDKNRCFTKLSQLGINTPASSTFSQIETSFSPDTKCIVKPASNSGGSSFVFLAKDRNEAKMYAEYLIRNKLTPIIQEYIPHHEGEFTVGTLKLGGTVASIALKRTFSNKLSILQKSDTGIISTGYSQGEINDFPEIREVCEKIAVLFDGEGPLNIQGRFWQGKFYPFEINPRFSASTYLRSLAGFNEIDMFIKYRTNKKYDIPTNIKYGYYMRTLSEIYIPSESLK